MVIWCVYGFADIVKQSKYETVTRLDYNKIGRYLRGEWPKEMGEMIYADSDFFEDEE